jgi:hypothetical protein
MPTYEAFCHTCKTVQDYYQPVSRYMDTPECCGAKTQKVILTAPVGIVDIPAYVSPTTGKLIDSRSKRREDLKASGSREWEGMEQEQKVAQQRVKAEEKKADAAIESAVVSAWQALPSESRRALESNG